MSHRNTCPPRWKAEREGERAQERGNPVYNNPYSRKPFDQNHCRDAERAWENGHRAAQAMQEQREREERRARQASENFRQQIERAERAEIEQQEAERAYWAEIEAQETAALEAIEREPGDAA